MLLVALPETMRRTESLPANGSTSVLKTKAENGAFGSAFRSRSSPVLGFVPFQAGC